MNLKFENLKSVKFKNSFIFLDYDFFTREWKDERNHENASHRAHSYITF